MAEPFELIDDDELALFLAMFGILEDQRELILANPAIVLSGEFWETQAVVASGALVPVIEEFVIAGVLNSLGDQIIDQNALFGHVQTATQTHVGNMIRRINETTQDKVIGLLDQSVAENWSLDQLAEALTNFPGSPFGEQRARLIAVTETTNSYMQGAEVLADELRNQGEVVEFIWLTANDDLVCEICAPRHLQPRGTNWTENAAAHPGCRCDIDVRVVTGG